VSKVRRASEDPDRFERESEEFHARVREAYRSLAAQRGWVVVDGNLEVDVVADKIWSVACERLEPGLPINPRWRSGTASSVKSVRSCPCNGRPNDRLTRTYSSGRAGQVPKRRRAVSPPRWLRPMATTAASTSCCAACTPTSSRSTHPRTRF